ncbi:UNKNOWN [Stylonychia lemnae]|uniref:Uncharacterized protein n=1 Tax=Stylonychia lemnae TaxID=5949 RepID=A0A078A8P4_STYLE|nr:UNKNOWN [Stylonychia lemnae]|eukprot:CDW78599.1 UNKNOWN [Stylonychia lemnae]
MNLQHYQTVKVSQIQQSNPNNPKMREANNDQSQTQIQQRVLKADYQVQDNNIIGKQVKHISRSPIAYPQENRLQEQNFKQLAQSQNFDVSASMPPKKAQQSVNRKIYHQRSLSPSVLNTQLIQNLYSNNINSSNNGAIQNGQLIYQQNRMQPTSQSRHYQNQLTSSYNYQPFQQLNHFEVVDDDGEFFQNTQKQNKVKNSIKPHNYGHKRIVQSVDFNMRGGYDQGLGLLAPTNHIPNQYVQENKNKVQKRDLSPIWGPDAKFQPQRDNFLDDIYARNQQFGFVGAGGNGLYSQQQQQYDDTYDPDIMVTESDVSHQSSFYEIPQDRKLKLHNNTNNAGTLNDEKHQMIPIKNKLFNQTILEQQQQPVGIHPFNSLLAQFQQQSQPTRKIQQSQTAKISPRQNLQYNQAQKNISKKGNKQQTIKNEAQVVKKSTKAPFEMSETQNKQNKNNHKTVRSPLNYTNSGGVVSGQYNENQNFTNNTLSSNRSHKSLEKDHNQIQPFQMSSESNSILLKSHHSTDQLDADIINKDSLTTRTKDKLNGVGSGANTTKIRKNMNGDSQLKYKQIEDKYKNGKNIYSLLTHIIIEITVLQQALLKQGAENNRLKTELEAFKLLSKSLLKQNKQFKLSTIDLKGVQKSRDLYLARIKNLELENLSLRAKNYNLIDKMQQTQVFLSRYALDELESSDGEQDYQLIEQLAVENLNLRGLLKVESDMDEAYYQIIQQEKQHQEANFSQDLQMSLLQTQQSESSVLDMISKASKQIKDNAKKRKEEVEANAVNQPGLTLDGKPEKFPFKNIKPKKAFLLGGPSSDSEETITNETEEESVNMQSPEQISQQEQN